MRRGSISMPGAAAAAGNGTLPGQLSTFVGRERELAELEALFETSRLVTITGPGGSGKTRVAVVLAERVRDRLADGVFFVDLAPLRDSVLVPSAIATALAIREAPEQSALDALTERLAERRVLLVLDNLEQLLPAGSAIVARLLAECPNLHVLATSRGPLHLRGEREYPLNPLRLPDSVELASPELLERNETVALFLDRSTAVSPQLRLTGDNAMAIAAICARLDGLPLAIELAAARTRFFGPEALLRRLEVRLPLLTAGPADAPARQRTLRDTIAWSFDLLSVAEQRIFARLSVFAGGATLDAATTVVFDPADPAPPPLIDALGNLVDQALLRVAVDSDGEPRFTMLETIRELAAERLEPADAEAARDRHLAWFTSWATAAEAEYRDARSVAESAMILRAWHLRLPPDLPNLRAALTWARDSRGREDSFLRLTLALAWLLDAGEIGPWLDDAMLVAGGSSPSLRASVAREAGEAAYFLGRPDIARERLELSLRLSESVGDDAGSALAGAALSTIDRATGDTDGAIARLDAAIGLARRSGDGLVTSTCLALRGSIAGQVGDSTTAGRLIEEAIAIDRAEHDAYHLAQNLNNLGYVLIVAERHTDAIAALTESVELFRETDSLVVAPLLDLAEALMASGRAAEARPLLLEAIGNAQTGGYAISQAAALERAAIWLALMDRPREAVVAWAAVEKARARWHMPTRVGSILGPKEHDRATSALGPAALEEARRIGAEMSLDDGIDVAVQAIDASESMTPRGAGATPRSRHDLTPRELEVLSLVAAGRSDGEIAEALFISKKTASVHVANIKGKLGAGSRVEMAMAARDLGLASRDPGEVRS